MSKSVLDLWCNCEPRSIGSVLQSTLSRWLMKVPRLEKAITRFVIWTEEMRHRGFFADYLSDPPKEDEFDMFMGRAVDYVGRCTTTLQETSKLQKGKAGRALRQAELFSANCKCFIGEIKFTIRLREAASRSLEMQNTFSSPSQPWNASDNKPVSTSERGLTAPLHMKRQPRWRPPL